MAEKIKGTDVDEGKSLLLSLLPSFRQLNDKQKFMARMEILTLQQNLELLVFHRAPPLVADRGMLTR